MLGKKNGVPSEKCKNHLACLLVAFNLMDSALRGEARSLLITASGHYLNAILRVFYHTSWNLTPGPTVRRGSECSPHSVMTTSVAAGVAEAGLVSPAGSALVCGADADVSALLASTVTGAGACAAGTGATAAGAA